MTSQVRSRVQRLSQKANAKEGSPKSWVRRFKNQCQKGSPKSIIQRPKTRPKTSPKLHGAHLGTVITGLMLLQQADFLSKFYKQPQTSFISSWLLESNSAATLKCHQPAAGNGPGAYTLFSFLQLHFETLPSALKEWRRCLDWGSAASGLHQGWAIVASAGCQPATLLPACLLQARNWPHKILLHLRSLLLMRNPCFCRGMAADMTAGPW